MDTKAQAVQDYDELREALSRFERYARKLIGQGERLAELRLPISSDSTRKAALKAIMDQTPDTVTAMMDEAKLSGTITTYLKGKFPDPEPIEPEEP